MDEKTPLLSCLGASTVTNCIPCLNTTIKGLPQPALQDA
jgi:hypothetical protein